MRKKFTCLKYGAGFLNLVSCLLLLCMLGGAAYAQNTVTGKVTSNENGEPLPGVNVIVVGTTAGTVTDVDGNYSLNVPSGDAVLQFSFIGYTTLDVPVDGRSTVNIALAPNLQELNEVVVTGFGTQTRRKLTSSIGTVDAQELSRTPVTNFENAMQGRVSGVTINQSAGTLGAPIAVRVRGATSVNASNQPLFVIDGVPLAVDNGAEGDIIGGSDFGTLGGTNPLVNLNPNDIQSIEVLKDAAATALYGARGANGVVLITTKRGEAGGTTVDLNYYGGISQPTNTVDVLSGPDYQRLRNYAGFGASGYNFLDPVNGRYFENPLDAPNTDFIDILTRTAALHQASASVSGGNQKTQFYAGVTWRDEEGWIRRTSLERISARLNLDHQLTDKFKLTLGINPTRTINQRQAEDNAIASPFTNGQLSRPDLPAYNEDGTVFLGNLFGGSPLGNLLNQERTLTTYRILSNLNLRYDILPGLSARAELGVDFVTNREQDRTQEDHTDALGTINGQGFTESAQVLNTNFNGLIDYSLSAGQSEIDITAGVTYQNVDAKSVFVEYNTFGSPLLPNAGSATENTGFGGIGTGYSFLGYLTRVNYTLDNKYIVQVSGRVDGSSRFGAENRYGFFPAISAGWILTEESFLEGVEAVNFLKLRASYGVTGNAEIANFASRGLASFTSVTGYNGQPGFEQTSLENPNLTWEETRQLDVSIDYGFLENRISGTLGYYRKQSVDLLLEVPLPQEAGIASAPVSIYQNNVGEVVNSGLEFDLTADIVRSEDFTWTFNGNISTLRNEITFLPDNDNSGEPDDITISDYIYRQGEALPTFFLVRYAGVDPENGDALFLTADGEVTNTYSSSYAVPAGDPLPDYFGGFTNTFTWRGFDASIFFQYSYGQEIYRSEGEFITTNGYASFNQATSQLNAWTPDNTITDVPQARAGRLNGNQASTRYLEDASYMRLKNATLGYTFPASLVGDTKLRIYTQGLNLLTFTDFQGADPEVSRGDPNSPLLGETFFSRPQSRVVTLGVNVTF